MKGKETRREKGRGGKTNTDDYQTLSNHTQKQNHYLKEVLTLLMLIDTTLLVHCLTYSLPVP